MLSLLFSLFFLLFTGTHGFSVCSRNGSVGIGTNSITPSAFLDIVGGVVQFPVLTTTQKLAIPFPVTSLTVVDSTEPSFSVYSNVTQTWSSLTAIKYPRIDIQSFTSNGTWIRPGTASSTLLLLRVIVIGAGASGNGGGWNSSAVNVSGALGGGGGALSVSTFYGDFTPTTVTVTVGIGGNPGLGKNLTNSVTAGENGGNSSFGDYVFAGGGLINGMNSPLGYYDGMLLIPYGNATAQALYLNGSTGTDLIFLRPSAGGTSGLARGTAATCNVNTTGSNGQNIVPTTGGSTTLGGIATATDNRNGNSNTESGGSMTLTMFAGSGGAGGTSKTCASGTTGGDGGLYGAGGGGGGSSAFANNTFSGGNGGRGANGFVYVITMYF